MIDIVLFIVIIILSIIGLIGCVLPALPGPPLNFLGVLIVYFYYSNSISTLLLLVLLSLTIIVFGLDYILPLLGAKLFDASKRGIYGGIIGLIAGLLLFPPFGMIIGLLLGTIIGELTSGKENIEALKVGFVSFLFSILVMIIKLGFSAYMSYVAVSRMFENIEL